MALSSATANSLATALASNAAKAEIQTLLDYEVSTANGLTAAAGGGQSGALQLSAYANRVTTVATAADSVRLPAALPGAQVVVINAAAANSMNVFPQTGDAINALAANTALAVAANKTLLAFCAVAGIWNTILTA